jgi:hypothetical protein
MYKRYIVLLSRKFMEEGNQSELENNNNDKDLEGKLATKETQKLTDIAIIKTLQDKALESQETLFLTNAPQEAKVFFFNMTQLEKVKAMNTFRYNPATIDILDENGEIVASLEKEDHTVPDSELKPWMIEKDEAGNTFFSFEAIKDDELVPTDVEWEKMLRLMPAQDYRINGWCRACKQLHALLWGKLSNIRPSPSAGGGADGFYWSRSVYKRPRGFAFALRADADGYEDEHDFKADGGEFSPCYYTQLYPVRRFATKAA